jgi:hypothetical protein
LNTRQTSLDHKLHSLVHIGWYDSLIGMGCGPYAYQLIHETLPDISNTIEVDFHRVEIGIQPVQKPPRLTTRYEDRPDLEELDYRPRPNKRMVAGELREDTGQRPIGLRIYLTYNGCPSSRATSAIRTRPSADSVISTSQNLNLHCRF